MKGYIMKNRILKPLEIAFGKGWLRYFVPSLIFSVLLFGYMMSTGSQTSEQENTEQEITRVSPSTSINEAMRGNPEIWRQSPGTIETELQDADDANSTPNSSETSSNGYTICTYATEWQPTGNGYVGFGGFVMDTVIWFGAGTPPETVDGTEEGKPVNIAFIDTNEDGFLNRSEASGYMASNSRLAKTSGDVILYSSRASFDFDWKGDITEDFISPIFDGDANWTLNLRNLDAGC